MFNPRTVAVVGASRKPGKIGHEILRNLKLYGFYGRIYPVNPAGGTILGFKVYKSVKEIPEEVDLGVIAIPADKVIPAVEELGEKGAKAVAVISSGFGEVGRKDLEEKLVKTAHKYGMRVLGPNIFGLVYTPSRLNATFGPTHVLEGSIAFISQSGALGIALMGWTILEEIGLSAVVSVGNKSDIDDADLMEFFAEDPHTKVIAIYMEGVKNGRRFLEVARKVTLKKPVIVLKAGRSAAGARAAASHTGALAGADVIFDAVFKQAGILRAITVEEMFDWARAFACLEPPEKEDVVIITNGGGAGVMATDAVEDHGLKLLTPSKELVDEFRKYMPPFGSPRNPVDLTGQASAEDYYGAIKAALKSPEVGSIIVLYCRTAVLDPADLVEQTCKAVKEVEEEGIKKPIVAALVGGEDVLHAIKKFNKRGIPAYPIPERAVSSLAALVKWARRAGKMKK